MIFLISWYQPTEDIRPLTCPTNKEVLAWYHNGDKVKFPEDGKRGDNNALTGRSKR